MSVQLIAFHLDIDELDFIFNQRAGYCDVIDACQCEQIQRGQLYRCLQSARSSYLLVQRSPISSKQLHNHSCTTAEYQIQCRRSLVPLCNQAPQTTRFFSDSHFAPLGANEERGVRLVHQRITRFYSLVRLPYRFRNPHHL